MGYGRSVAASSSASTVPDEDLGPLVASDMTAHPLHCCVRVTSEIAGSYELG